MTTGSPSSALQNISRVIVVPRNGYANRLQAWASASVIGHRADAEVQVLWEPEANASASPLDLFDSSWFERQSISTREFIDLAGKEHSNLPRYLSTDATRGIVSLAGHDRGEQALLGQLKELDQSLSSSQTLIIIAGGKFFVTSEGQANRDRHSFYRSLKWSPEVKRAVKAASSDVGPYAALHIRTTDRSIEAPGSRKIRHALRQVREQFPDHSLFICTDTLHSRLVWRKEASNLGFETWSAVAVEYDRSLPGNGTSAMVDWLLLANADVVIHPRESTFSAEACIAGGTWDVSRPLGAERWLQSGRHLRRYVRDIATYPRRLLRSSGARAS